MLLILSYCTSIHIGIVLSERSIGHGRMNYGTTQFRPQIQDPTSAIKRRGASFLWVSFDSANILEGASSDTASTQ